MMNKTKLASLVCLALTAFPIVAQATRAEDAHVVEVTVGANHLILKLDKTMNADCGNKSKFARVTSSDISEQALDRLTSAALTAKVTGGRVKVQASNACSSRWTRASKLCRT